MTRSDAVVPFPPVRSSLRPLRRHCERSEATRRTVGIALHAGQGSRRRCAPRHDGERRSRLHSLILRSGRTPRLERSPHRHGSRRAAGPPHHEARDSVSLRSKTNDRILKTKDLILRSGRRPHLEGCSVPDPAHGLTSRPPSSAPPSSPPAWRRPFWRAPCGRASCPPRRPWRRSAAMRRRASDRPDPCPWAGSR
jgi:hypothetical protein